MIIVPVGGLPEPRKKVRCTRNGEYLNNFLDMKVKYAWVDVEQFEYAHVYSAYTSLRRIAKFYSLPVDVKIINGEVYFVNLLMEDEL